MRHMPLIITLIISTGAHAALFLSMSGLPTDTQSQRTPIVEIGLVHHIANELAAPAQEASPSEPVACNPQTSTPKNQDTEVLTSTTVMPEHQTMTAETTKEVAPAAAESGPTPTPLLSDTPQQVDLVANRAPLEHASTVPSAATAPVCTYNPPPNYPAVALRQNWEGEVLLQATISDDGNVEGVHITSSSGYTALDEAAVEAVLTWQFTATATASGSEPVAVSIPVHFRIRNE